MWKSYNVRIQLTDMALDMVKRGLKENNNTLISDAIEMLKNDDQFSWYGLPSTLYEEWGTLLDLVQSQHLRDHYPNAFIDKACDIVRNLYNVRQHPSYHMDDNNHLKFLFTQ